jgi:hypothetical protein
MKKDPTALPIYTGIAIIVFLTLIFKVLGLRFDDISTVFFVFFYVITFYIILTKQY